MPKEKKSRSRWGSLLFWSIISAAFIGPGTVTTAAKAGATYQYHLVWALLFSVIACWMLQETAARLPMIRQRDLGATIAERYQRIPWIKQATVWAIIVGGIAYQAGNILGGVKGAALILNIDPDILTIILGVLAALVLSSGNEQRIAKGMGIVVAIMGLAFVAVAVTGTLGGNDPLTRSLTQTFPSDAGWVVLGLIGTTIVPYNLFLASGIKHNQDIKTLRWGIRGAIAIGGIISLAILLVGTQVQGEFSFEELAQKMSDSLGNWANVLFALGLFSAGFTSAITAPLAAAITARSIWGYQREDWHSQSIKFRLVWGSVMLAGIIFGISGIKPIPAIILAQAMNGLLLPFIAILLFVAINEKGENGNRGNTGLQNVVMLMIIAVTVVLGLISLYKAWASLAIF